MRPYLKTIQGNFGKNSRKIYVPQPNPDRQHMLFYASFVGYEEILSDYYNEKNGAPYYVLNYTVSGSAILETKNKTFDVQAGDLLFLDKKERHAMKLGAECPWIIYFIHLKSDEIQNFLTAFHQKSQAVIHNYPSEYIVPHIQNILDGVPNSKLDLYDVSQEIYKIFLNMMRFLDKQPDRIYGELSFVLEYINANYRRQNLSLDEIVNKSNYSKSHLERLFRQQLGTTPMRYVANLRFHRCQQLVLTTNMTLHEIARECGLSDARAVLYLFKQNLETTPTEFKRSFAAKPPTP